MTYVYLLRSLISPHQRYIGLTPDVTARVHAHNSGPSDHTSKYKSWKLVASFAFSDEQRAIDFEKYLESGSGRAFAARHLW